MPAENGWVHATAIEVAGLGLLIRGPSGAGKSRLACDMLFHAGEAGRAGFLIGDDRIMLWREGERLLARGHPAILGKLEIRGLGLVEPRTKPVTAIDWAIDLAGDGERLPAGPMRGTTRLLDLERPLIRASSGRAAATAFLAIMLDTVTFLTAKAV
jgi:HPr kinase/phosphorylase